jgi:hypothetical protein
MVTGTSPASGATVEIRADADESVLAMATTAADGTYTLPSIASGGKPIAAHAHISLTGLAPTIFYVVDGLRTNKLSTEILDPAIHDSLAKGAGVTWNHANGIVSVSVRKCNSGNPSDGLAGAVVTMDPGSTTLYDDGNGNPMAGGSATKAPSGNAYDFNVPPGHAAVNLLYQNALTTTTVEVAAGSFTFLLDFP